MKEMVEPGSGSRFRTGCRLYLILYSLLIPAERAQPKDPLVERYVRRDDKTPFLPSSQKIIKSKCVAHS